MTPTDRDRGVTGGEKAWRITRLGSLLRKTRLDEIPQLWNVLKGDISFVGPRPPDYEYVRRLPELYAQVLQQRPGITGLASLIYHAHEEKLLSRCATPEETDRVYVSNCAPRKARLDLIYSKHRSFGFDLWILWHTFLNRIAPRAANRHRIKAGQRARRQYVKDAPLRPANDANPTAG